MDIGGQDNLCSSCENIGEYLLQATDSLKLDIINIGAKILEKYGDIIDSITNNDRSDLVHGEYDPSQPSPVLDFYGVPSDHEEGLPGKYVTMEGIKELYTKTEQILQNGGEDLDRIIIDNFHYELTLAIEKIKLYEGYILVLNDSKKDRGECKIQ